jgi:CoA:oxalate CoA-transferase
MADLGAEVIKVEPPSGDDYRHIGPFKNGRSALFTMMNRGKKSIVLDLKQADGLKLIHGLAAKADVVVENFTPGVAARLGIGSGQLRASNPRLVYASISGFGQEGPLADRPSYDLIAQAMTGMMDVTGDADGPPMRVGESIADLAAGLYAAWAVTTGLFVRERTGRGRHLDIAMFDTLFSLLPTAFAQYAYADTIPHRVGNRHPLSTPFGSFRCADGDVIIAVANDRLFRRLTEVIGDPRLADDPRCATDSERTRHEPQVRAAIEAWSGSRPVAEVVAILSQAGIPTAPIWNIAQAAESAQVTFRRMVSTIEDAEAGLLKIVEQPVHFSDVERGLLVGVPELGQDTVSVLTELLGCDRSSLERLAVAGVIKGVGLTA